MTNPSGRAFKGDGSFSSPESKKYISTWLCPHCRCSYCLPSKQTGTTSTSGNGNDDDKKPMVFLRGTCHHDVCYKCLANLLTLVKKKKNSANEDVNNLIVMVPCPIVMDHCGGNPCSGKFLLDGVNFWYCCSLLYLNNSNDDLAIDLCDDQHGEESNSPSLASTVVSADVLRNNGNPIQEVVKSEPKDSDLADPNGAGVLVTVRSAMKEDVRTSGAQRVVTRKMKQENRHQPKPVLSVRLSSLSSSFAASRANSTRSKRANIVSPPETRSTMRVKKDPSGTDTRYEKRSPVKNIEKACRNPEEIESTNGILREAKRLKTTRSKSENISTPESGAKNDDSGTDAISAADTAVIKVEKADSRPEEIRSENWTSPKMNRLEKKLEEELQRSKFWSVNPNDVSEIDDLLNLDKPIFHLNSFGSAKKKVNEAFSEFIREGVATPGFFPLPATLDIAKIASWTYEELRDEISSWHFPEIRNQIFASWTYPKLRDVLEKQDDWAAKEFERLKGASKTALWLSKATVGSFVIMRHEYPKSKFCPKRLKVDGKYIGKVYVIGIITKKVIPYSEEERDIADNKLGDLSKDRWWIHNVCRVSWQRMGYKNSLKPNTRKYINKICQSTLQQICADPTKEYEDHATSASIRKDLWMNATIPIRHDEFSDRFDHCPEP